MAVPPSAAHVRLVHAGVGVHLALVALDLVDEAPMMPPKNRPTSKTMTQARRLGIPHVRLQVLGHRALLGGAVKLDRLTRDQIKPLQTG